MTFQLEKFDAPALLQMLIGGYYVITNHKEGDPSSNDRLNLPQGTLDLVFMPQGKLSMKSAGKLQRHTNHAFLVGQQGQHPSFFIKPGSQVFGVAFTSIGVRRWINFPLSETKNTLIPLADEHVSFDIKETLDILSGNFTTQQKIIWLSNMLLSQLRYVDPGLDKVDQKMLSLHQSSHLLTIKDLMNHLNMSHRTLHRWFKNTYGLAPKQYLQLRRFQKVLNLMRHHKRFSMGDITYMCGYFDQNHFIKEFKTMTGLSPKSFIKNTPRSAGFFLETC